MNRTIIAHFDGKVIVPEKPVKLPVGQLLRVQRIARAGQWEEAHQTPED